ALVCLPKAPLCGRCPLARWCRTRGELERGPRPARTRSAAAYSLAMRGGRVLLVKRPESSAHMPGMWELPPADLRGVGNGAHPAPLMRLRHSITETDYVVKVFQNARGRGGRWVASRRLGHLPLTGLARKILRRAGMIQ
ncbi:MAG: A/G-specific adenine glycosylase, partial [Terriglobales bacterium]